MGDADVSEHGNLADPRPVWKFSFVPYPFDVTKHFAVKTGQPDVWQKDRRKLTYAHTTDNADLYAYVKAEGSPTGPTKKKKACPFQPPTAPNDKADYLKIKCCKDVKVTLKSRWTCFCCYHNEYYRAPPPLAQADSVPAGDEPQSSNDVPPVAPQDENVAGMNANAQNVAGGEHQQAGGASRAQGVGVGRVNGLDKVMKAQKARKADEVNQIVEKMPKGLRKGLGIDAGHIGIVLYKHDPQAKRLVRRSAPPIYNHAPAPPMAQELVTSASLPTSAMYFYSDWEYIDPMAHFDIVVYCPLGCTQGSCSSGPVEDPPIPPADGAPFIPPPPPASRVALKQSSIYERPRSVMSLRKMIKCIAARYVCPKCNKKFIAWSDSIMQQVPQAYRDQYGIVLTHRGGVTQEVVDRLSLRYKGNSAAAVLSQIENNHFNDHAV
jgi:hypothetical protein